MIKETATSSTATNNTTTALYNVTPSLHPTPDITGPLHNLVGVDQRVGRFFWDGYLCKKKVSRLEKIQEYFTDSQLTTVLLPIIRKDCALSLRALDWLVTNYSKKIPVIYKVKPPNCPEIIVNIYRSYKSWLWNHKRKNFDPFRRGKRIMFKIHETDTTVHESTVGQLNFFFWASRYGVLDFAQSNIKEIEKDQAVATKILPEGTDNETGGARKNGATQVDGDQVDKETCLQPSTETISACSLPKRKQSFDTSVDTKKSRAKQTSRESVPRTSSKATDSALAQKQGNKKKRRQLSHAPKETVFVYPTTIRVVFNPEINQF